MTLTKRLVGGNPLVSVYIVFYSLFYFFSDLVCMSKKRKTEHFSQNNRRTVLLVEQPIACSKSVFRTQKKIIKKEKEREIMESG